MITGLSWYDLRIWLALTTALLAVQGWIMYGKAWRKEPPGFLWRSFMDARDVPDGKLLTVFNAVGVLNVTMVVGWLTGHWPPAYVWATWGTIVLLGIGADTYITRSQIAASAAMPTPEAGSAEAQLTTPPVGDSADPSPTNTGPL